MVLTDLPRDLERRGQLHPASPREVHQGLPVVADGGRECASESRPQIINTEEDCLTAKSDSPIHAIVNHVPFVPFVSRSR